MDSGFESDDMMDAESTGHGSIDHGLVDCGLIGHGVNDRCLVC